MAVRHCAPPGKPERQAEAPCRRQHVGSMGVAARQRESAQHRRPSRSEHGGAGHLATVAVALEVTGYGNAFRVVLAKARLLSVDPFECLDEDVRCQPWKLPRPNRPHRQLRRCRPPETHLPRRCRAESGGVRAEPRPTSGASLMTVSPALLRTRCYTAAVASTVVPRAGTAASRPWPVSSPLRRTAVAQTGDLTRRSEGETNVCHPR